MSDLASVVIYQGSSEPIAACWPVRTEDSLVPDVATLASPTILLVNFRQWPRRASQPYGFPRNSRLRSRNFPPRNEVNDVPEDSTRTPPLMPTSPDSPFPRIGTARVVSSTAPQSQIAHLVWSTSTPHHRGGLHSESRTELTIKNDMPRTKPRIYHPVSSFYS